MSYPRMRLDRGRAPTARVTRISSSEGRNFLDQGRRSTANRLVYPVVKAKKVRPAGEPRARVPGISSSRGMLPQAVNCITLPKLRGTQPEGYRVYPVVREESSGSSVPQAALRPVYPVVKEESFLSRDH